MRIRLVLGGREYSAGEKDLGALTIGEIRSIEAHTGLTPSGLGAKFTELAATGAGGGGIDEMGVLDVFAVTVFLLMSRSGEPVTWDEVEAIPVVDLVAGFSVVGDEPAAVANGAVGGE